MPINISTVPKKRVTKSKKQEDATRVHKNNTSGPDPNAPQPPFPADSDGTDNDADADHATQSTASPMGAGAGSSVSTAVGDDTTPKGRKSQKNASSYDRLEVNRMLSDLLPRPPPSRLQNSDHPHPKMQLHNQSLKMHFRQLMCQSRRRQSRRRQSRRRQSRRRQSNQKRQMPPKRQSLQEKRMRNQNKTSTSWYMLNRSRSRMTFPSA